MSKKPHGPRIAAILDRERRGHFIDRDPLRVPPPPLTGVSPEIWRSMTPVSRADVLDRVAPLNADPASLHAALLVGAKRWDDAQSALAGNARPLRGHLPFGRATPTPAPPSRARPARPIPTFAATQVVPCAAQCGDYVPARGHAPRLLWCDECTGNGTATDPRDRRRGEIKPALHGYV